MKNRAVLSSDDWQDATATQLEQQIAYELEAIAGRPGMTQEKLADVLGYAGQAGANRLIGRTRGLTADRARKLDSDGYTTSIGVSFEDLVTALRRTRNSRKPSTRPKYDIFLAAPMAATGKGYAKQRKLVMELKDALENAASRSVYYAGTAIETEAEFDAQHIAYIANYDAIRESRQLVLYLPKKPSAGTPSSIWVEVGMALAWGIPCTFFVPDLDCLPYVIQRAFDEPKTRRKLVDVYAFGDKAETPAQHVRRHWHKLELVLAGG